jgi:CheY-like chemotaxis protein
LKEPAAKPLMFRANLTISKIAQESARPFGRAFLFAVHEFEKQHPRTKSPGVTEGFGNVPSAKRYACRDFLKGLWMSKVSVLVVDDASFIRDLVKKCLRNYFPNMRIEDAVNGKKAQVLLAKEAFDLVLCDWEMPEMSGLELLTWCREQDSLKGMPFVMVTSRGDKENVVQAIQAGVSGYVSKPFTNEQLLTKVKQALHKVGKLDAVMSTSLRSKQARRSATTP